MTDMKRPVAGRRSELFHDTRNWPGWTAPDSLEAVISRKLELMASRKAHSAKLSVA